LRVSSPSLTEGPSGRARIEARLESARGSEALWYEVEPQHAHGLVSDRVDGFAIAALLIAMERHETELVLEGPVSQLLAHNIETQLVPLLKLLVPRYATVRLEAPARVSATSGGTGVVTGFSGGVDSFSTLADYWGDRASQGFALTHLLYCNVGSHGHGSTGARVFDERWQLVKDFGPALGLEFVRVDSNLDDLVATDIIQSHPLRNTSAALMLQGLFRTYLYSSSYRYQDCHFGPTHGIAHADPVTVPLMSTEATRCISTSGRYSRLERAGRAATVPLARQTLNVCQRPLDRGGRNCAHCPKCLRTLAALEVQGLLEEFGQVFDLAEYRKRANRDWFLMMLPSRTKDAHSREILEYIREHETPLPFHISAVHRLWPLLQYPYAAARTVKHALSSGGR
jgi:hypothetical protein